MSDIRELRLAIERKLKHRQQLLEQNARLRDELGRERSRNDFMQEAFKSEIAHHYLEKMADDVVRMILEKALEASEVVARETMGSGDYEIGIDMPSLHIHTRISKLELDFSRPHREDPIRQMEVKRVRYDGRDT